MIMLKAGLLAASLVGTAVAQPAPTANAPKSPATILEEAPAQDWVTIEPENLLVMELPSGPMVIEMRPDLAPKHVQRIKALTREGFYDGVTFHRVIDGFMAQGGDPTGTGKGGSELGNVEGEFVREATTIANKHMIGRDDRAAAVGFVGTVPVGTQSPTLPKFLAQNDYALWGLHCQGVMSMARAGDPNSADSQFFVMFGDSRNGLDQGYTVWGKVVDGYFNARRISRGEPPVRPTPIVRMRVMADIPASEQETVEYLDPGSEAFKDYLVARRAMRPDGYVKDMCGIDVPVRINGELPE
ncbi:peptidylprolyl isomerase [Parvularcula sp. LCG005]|uniref:peptidylprolyl isomerase n=1 Tax=Parvularcula sp. LCG005 TaxID=3078805 RepID=UPI0029436157|nr:peptidylprolyl isomerase [Parvularcula sp. LCG005]WOI54710.1 peptidylprolyl isomerase [Parvularcula sp. LCG005]